jgi:hypothetical protein
LTVALGFAYGVEAGPNALFYILMAIFDRESMLEI